MSKSKTKEFLVQPKNNYPRQKTSPRPLRIYRSFLDHDQPNKNFCFFYSGKGKKELKHLKDGFKQNFIALITYTLKAP